MSAVLAVGIGAALGAWLRWALSSAMNPLFPLLPFGTLTSNLVGGYLIGFAVAWFGASAEVSHEARLFVITGFLGGLTTFSTFSAEAVALVQRSEYGWAAALMAAHLLGSLAMTVLGMLSFGWITRSS